MNLRDLPRLDYQKFNQSGEKVYKNNRGLNSFNMEALVSEEKKNSGGRFDSGLPKATGL